MKDPPSSSSLPPPQQQQQPKEGLEHGWCWGFERGFQGAEGAFPFLAVNEEFPPSRVSSRRVSLPSVFLEEKFSLEENPADRGSQECHLFPFMQKTTKLLWGAGSHLSALCVALDSI